jgi:hypothetical protein
LNGTVGVRCSQAGEFVFGVAGVPGVERVARATGVDDVSGVRSRIGDVGRIGRVRSRIGLGIFDSRISHVGIGEVADTPGRAPSVILAGIVSDNPDDHE